MDVLARYPGFTSGEHVSRQLDDGSVVALPSKPQRIADKVLGGFYRADASVSDSWTTFTLFTDAGDNVCTLRVINMTKLNVSSAENYDFTP